MYAKASLMSQSLDESKKSTKLKKQHSLILNNHDTNADQRKDSKETENENSDDKFKQFEDKGVVFKTKLIGSELVMEPRGDKMCQNSIQRLEAIIKCRGTRDGDGSSMLCIRRSTSLSYTSTLRRRQALSPLAPEPAELPSPKPNVVLPNFTISAYDSSTARKSLNWH